MKLSKNLKHEVKLHLFWLMTLWPGALLFALMFTLPIFDGLQVWGKIAAPVVCAMLHYAWWRHCLSPDKTRFTPKWW